MDFEYRYLFPFEKVKQGAEILIYGAGEVGQAYLKQLIITGYCHPIAFLDRAYMNRNMFVVPVYEPNIVKNIKYDYIVIAMKAGYYVRNIQANLKKMGVSDEKIIYVPARQSVSTFTTEIDKKVCSGEAYEKVDLSIALKYGPGLGDAIVKKKMFVELTKMAQGCKVDIYTPSPDFVKSIYSDCESLCRIIDDGGAIYEKECHKYKIAITTTFNMIHIDAMNFKGLEKCNRDFANKMLALQAKLKEYNLSNKEVVNRFIHIQRMKFLGLNYYNYLNFTKVFHITDMKVNIPLDEKMLIKFNNMPIKGIQYITLNYGSGAGSGNKDNYVAKQWPYDSTIKLVKLLKNRYPHIRIVQLGSINAKKILGADYYFLGMNLEIVKYIIKNSILHIDNEGGLVHLGTQLNTKCIVMFGPTQECFFGYPQNINIVIGNCHDCHFLYDGVDVCARHMNVPDCMRLITPEKVMEKIDKYISDNCQEK